jgi:hypothetical protein
MASLTDPEVTKSERIRDKEKVLYLVQVEEVFLLALCPKKPARPNTDYVTQLYTFYGTLFLALFILLWLQTFFKSPILFLFTSSGKKT